MSTIIDKLNIDIPDLKLDGLDLIETDEFGSFFGFQKDKFDRLDKNFKDSGSFDDLNPDSFGDDFIKGGDNKDSIFMGAKDNPIKGSDLFYGTPGGDVFEFDAEDFISGDFDSVVDDFQFGEDGIVIKGLSDSDQVGYDPITDNISVNGHVIDLNESPELNIKENKDGDYEIL